MAWLFENLRGEVESGKVVLGVETHAMRRALEGLIRMPVVYLPHPVEFHTETRRRGGVESSEFLTTEDTESTEGQAGLRLSSQAGAAFSYPSSSKVDVSPVSESLTRSASIPASTLATSNSLPATAAKPLIFGCYGAARWEKGTDVLQAAIRLVLQEKPEIPANFVFQWLEDFKDEHGLCVSLDPWMREHPKVEVVERYFNEGEIHLRLAETDVMVLPYRKPYRLRVSRVVIEAMLNGMPVIATEDTTLLEQANEHGCGLACQEGSAESLARAILQAAANSDLMQRVAKEKAPEVQSNFSVDRFRQILMNQATERQRQ
jgi:glycosyltransferase involved in cell wall biosynthesis